MTRILCCSAATAALLAACAPPPPPPEPLPPPPPMIVQPVLSQAGMDCVIRAGAMDLYEIEAGRLALQMSSNANVRAYAQMMIDQHTASSAQYGAALQSIGMNPPPAQLTPDLSARLERLRTAGTGFDAMYLDDQIAAHQQALALHQACAANGGAPVAAVSAGLVPHVQGHLNQAQALRASWSTQAGERG
jgi:putative membrane protein